jgi:cytochrome c
MFRQLTGFAFAAALGMTAMAGSALAEGDAAAGEKVFKKCKACHSMEAGKNKVGPSLAGIVGATPGTVEGFKYSDAMVEFGAGGAVWDEATLDAFLKKPKDVIKKTKMSFAGLKKDEDRADVIAYMKAN